jgi:hypothetical protein
MDREMAAKVLAEYWQAVVDAGETPLLSRQRMTAVAGLNIKVRKVNLVLRELAPDLPLISGDNLAMHRSARKVLDKAEAILTAWELLDRARVGESPALPLMMLDPVIVNAALPLWKVGKYRQAVMDAATSLNQFAQGQIGRRDISDKNLMGEAFSDKPPEPGKARLRCYRAGRPMETVQSQQEGARAFCQGAFQAIRNPAHHVTGDWNPMTAFHHLAALSQVAHYFRDWKVITYVERPPDISKLTATTKS